MAFKGFAPNHGATEVPTAFFQELLPEIDHLGELKISLYAVARLGSAGSQHPYLEREDVLADRKFMAGFGETAGGRADALDEALAKAVDRGTLLRAQSGAGEGARTLYLLNSPRGRAALQGLESGHWAPGEGRLAELAPRRPNIYQLYEENIGPLTPMLAESLREAEAEYPADWIEEAIEIALENNVRKWRYIDAILRSWREEGRDDGEDRKTVEKRSRKYTQGEFSDFIER